MTKNDLVNRTKFSNSLSNELMDAFNSLAEETQIPKSRLLDRAVELLLLEHGKEIPKSKVK